MPAITEFRLPAADVALETTLDRAPGATIRLERSVSIGFPAVLVSGSALETIDAALAADGSVDSFERRSRSDQTLYDVAFDPPARDRLEAVLAGEGTVLEATAAGGRWHLELRFPDRETLSRSHDRLAERGMEATIGRIANVTDGSGAGRAGTESRLTPEQEEALSAAFEHGYFEIPRAISMEDLAARLGISHQALSERLRRAYGTLVEAEFRTAAGERPSLGAPG
ncbi:helix-turn-helix domain-containing protein [Saliphagus infecundisoli]|uniref:Helix-turn-helix domain-containing protein n=1 Tax=Saliphagus infecundisoli TaxID=1849069 RepID=A0ABD5QHY9_9EURY|nr:helix-turn-helix domain-containing protein [Saliphagus infecundisoli]